MKNIVLASQSPRRKELLQMCTSDFICDPADIDESIEESNPLPQEIENLSFRKAKEVLNRHPDSIVIGSDTTVAINGMPLGKPKDDEEAFQMLKLLENKTHQVITGLAIISTKRVFHTVSVVNVTFHHMSDEEIWEYIHTGECNDKAGSYAIQGYGSRYIKEISGDYFSVVGLPVHLVYQELKNRSLY